MHRFRCTEFLQIAAIVSPLPIAASLHAQATTGPIPGNATDSARLLFQVPRRSSPHGAGVSRTSTTDGESSYSAEGLPDHRYMVDTSKKRSEGSVIQGNTT